MKIYQCDRCGHIQEHPEDTYTDIHFEETFISSSEDTHSMRCAYDLCKSCFAEFKLFLEYKKEI
jgi:hypothetical protein